MAGRGGLMDLPPHSLIQLTHVCAQYLKVVYDLIKNEVLQSRVLHADETPHRMLEGSQKKSWFLWGFATREQCFLDCRDTRSGDVASEVLVKWACEILLTDVFSGYGKAIGATNKIRAQECKREW